MNPTIAFPLPPPVLKINSSSAERWEFALQEERRRLNEDQEALREREQNLRNYEARLRALQNDISSGRVVTASPFLGSKPPFPTRPVSRSAHSEDGSLATAWDKLHRARELLEAEQEHLRNDRHFLREQEVTLKHREQAVAEREERVAEREAELAAAASPGRPAATEESSMVRLTRMPFDVARSMLGGKKQA